MYVYVPTTALCMDEQLHRVALESVKDRFATNE